ncbi:hypothetical protein KXD93_22885 [Mucilaginibacter sp. BJC16-A38]|uniref:hypothetical protein n=1 Tax=Mucilaginibacter phenanthrenivorans TaxID=1234842 RepID=UPI00215896C1|nr:hypothetical protein [Mucilaginibacter phenanthrenivorans]MCR8560518.1 hypothetical protein [Mucilaginibacter phenanthrenivorans]
MFHPFSVTETLNIAWHIFKKNFATIVVYSLLAIVLIGAIVFVIDFILADAILASIGVFVLLIGISFIFLGFIKLVFQLLDREYYDFEFRDIVPKIKMLLSYLTLLVIVSTLAVFMTNLIKNMNESFIQNVLGILVGVFFEFFFLFYFPICTCFIVDDGSGPFESIAQSFQLIKGNFLKYFLLFILIEALVFVGSITIIGMVVVVPFVNILLVVAYRKLIYSHLDVDDDITETV